MLQARGRDNPNTSEEYREAIEALYAVAFTAKFKVKRRDPAADFAVMPLQGLWWADANGGTPYMEYFITSDKNLWKWTMMIAQPEQVTGELLQEVMQEVEKKKKLGNLGKLRLEKYDEGLSAQVMHLGPYWAEGPTIEMERSAVLHASNLQHQGRLMNDSRGTGREGSTTKSTWGTPAALHPRNCVRSFDSRLNRRPRAERNYPAIVTPSNRPMPNVSEAATMPKATCRTPE